MGSQDEVMSLAAERRSERAGRTKAERQLRELQLEYGMVKERLERKSKTKITSSIEIEDDTENSCKGTWGPQHEEDGQALGAYPLRPIGILRSCYNNRNGTPRQPLLVSSARSYLELRPELANSGIFDGLAQYSHVWVIYIFNKNTDIHRLWQDDPYNGVRSKVRVPRLNGERLGVFATRSPHRPCPIGLSCARIVHIENNRIVEFTLLNHYKVVFDYASTSLVMNILNKHQAELIEQSFEEKCSIIFGVSDSKQASLSNDFEVNQIACQFLGKK